MNTELKPPTTQAEALALIGTLNDKISRHNADTRTAYARLQELIRLLLPE